MDEETVKETVPQSVEGVDVDALRADIADLKAKLAAYEPPPYAPQPYPRWVTNTKDGAKFVVADEAAFDALGPGWE